MGEKISVREAARRLGVSDTAVHKALKKGRVSIDPSSRLLDWEETRARWLANSDVSKRSHVGERGAPKRAGETPAVKLATSARMDEGDGYTHEVPETGRGPAYAKARAAQEVFKAKLTKLKYEKLSDTLIEKEDVRVTWGRHINACKTQIMGIPAACKSRVPELPLEAIALIEQICCAALEDLANGYC